MSHVLSVQDLSCVGRCSLTVALPVLSAMGHQCSVLPTAVLSTHTGFPGPEAVDLTESIPAFYRHWETQGISFDAISVGYLSSPVQAEAIEALLTRFPCPLVLDPVLGDGGTLYSRMTPAHAQALVRLLPRARVLLPNVTEAAVLTGLPFRKTQEEAYYASLAEGLLEKGTQAVVITGIPWGDGLTGWYYSDGRASVRWQGPRVPMACHGTGDLFSAAFTGAYLLGTSIPDSAALAAEFVRRCLDATPEASPMGAAFETALPWLWQRLQSS